MLWVYLLIGYFTNGVICNVSTQRSDEYMPFPGQRIKEQFIRTTVPAASKLMCAAICSADESSYSASWSSELKQCVLTHVTSTMIFEQQSWEKELVIGWETVGKILYEVAVYEGPGGRYTLTFQTATDHCQNLGSRVATVAELQVAFNAGFGLCRCAWAADGKLYLLLQTLDVNCHYTYGFVLCDWKTTGNVFCRI